jgi:hypothetical protein
MSYIYPVNGGINYKGRKQLVSCPNLFSVTKVFSTPDLFNNNEKHGKA